VELPRYLEDMLINGPGHMYLQHHEVPNSSYEVRNLLNFRFPGRWIGRGGPQNWPARSPNLSPLDCYVWGMIKELVYSVKVVTLDELVSRILDAANRIRNSQRKINLSNRAFHNRASSRNQFKLKVISLS